MALQMQWVEDSSLDRVAEARWLAYSHAGKDLTNMRDRIKADRRAASGDYLLAVRDGVDVGTATSLSMTMWMRGAAIPCQGVAWVGAAKTARRAGGDKSVGVATAVMHEMLRKGREREQPISALMPFRASYYEHFGYGLVERRNDWTIPLSILPSPSTESWSLATADDQPALVKLRQRMVESGQCDIERSAGAWEMVNAYHENGFVYLVRNADGDPIAMAFAMHESRNGKDILNLAGWIAPSFPAFASMLRMFSTLKDQYASLTISAPVHWPVNRVLKESQLPHRPVNHAHASLSTINRLQVRILDHRKLLEALHLASAREAGVTIAIHEPEGNSVRLALEFGGGRIACRPSVATPQFECNAITWAAVACGEISAAVALQCGLASGSADAARALNALADGPPPFTQEGF
jgi:predicted acetyltransferase